MMIKTLLLLMVIILSGCVETDYIVEPPLQNREGSISIVLNNSSILINENVQLSADAFDPDNNPVSSISFTWYSTDESILSVDQTGLVMGKSVGQAWVAVQAEGYKSDSTLITVVENSQQLASIVVTPNSGSLQIGESLQFSAKGFNNSGQEIDDLTFVWNSSDNNVISISSTGLATAINPGTASISASSQGINSSNIQVSVSGTSKSGSFSGNPATNYRVAGSAELINSNGNLILNFGSNFTCSSGPGLYVYLSPTNSVGSSSVEVGELISTTGAQSYSVPAGYTLNDFSYVIIYCKPFSVSFGSAELK